MTSRAASHLLCQHLGQLPRSSLKRLPTPSKSHQTHSVILGKTERERAPPHVGYHVCLQDYSRPSPPGTHTNPARLPLRQLSPSLGPGLGQISTTMLSSYHPSRPQKPPVLLSSQDYGAWFLLPQVKDSSWRRLSSWLDHGANLPEMPRHV